MSETRARSTLSFSLLPTADRAFYAQWEADVQAAARGLPGFLEAETFVPVAGIQDRWVLVLRIDGQAGVAAWLKSEQRTALLEQASAFSPFEQVITGVGSIKKPVTVLVETRVKPEDVEAFKAWQAEISEHQRKFPGYLDGKLLGPVAGVSDVWTNAMRFDSDEHVENWLHSAERRELMDKVAPRMLGNAPKKIVADLGGWFQVKSSEEPPSNWKQALCVLLALYPTVIALAELNLPARIWPTSPFASQMLVNNILSLILLTWFFMPPLTGFLQSWLQPPMDQSKSKATRATLAVLGLILLQLLLFLKIT